MAELENKIILAGDWTLTEKLIGSSKKWVVSHKSGKVDPVFDPELSTIVSIIPDVIIKASVTRDKIISALIVVFGSNLFHPVTSGKFIISFITLDSHQCCQPPISFDQTTCKSLISVSSSVYLNFGVKFGDGTPELINVPSYIDENKQVIASLNDIVNNPIILKKSFNSDGSPVYKNPDEMTVNLQACIFFMDVIATDMYTYLYNSPQDKKYVPPYGPFIGQTSTPASIVKECYNFLINLENYFQAWGSPEEPDYIAAHPNQGIYADAYQNVILGFFAVNKYRDQYININFMDMFVHQYVAAGYR